MATFNQVFERKEIKYHLNALQYRQLKAALSEYMTPDEYGRTLISSMYWDTPDRSVIGRSIEKPLYKEKVRLRRYGSPIALDNQPSFLEIKKKYKGIVYKRRVKMSGKAAELFLLGTDYESACLAFPLSESGATADAMSFREKQIGAELQHCRDFYGKLTPSMTIECQRTAWKLLPSSPDEWTQLRITFDEELTYQDLMTPGAKKQQLIDPTEVVLEIKAVGAMPRWLVSALNASGIRPGSFTKYGRAYQKLAG